MLLGVSLGNHKDIMLPESSDNPEGYWENLHFVELNEALLAALGGTWDNPPDLAPGWSDLPQISPFYDRALTIQPTFGAVSNWGWKDPRSMLTVEFWQKVYPGLSFVLCMRNPIEAAISFQRRSGYGRMDLLSALNLWVDYHMIALRTIADQPLTVTHYDSFLYDARAEAERLGQCLALPVTAAQLGVATSTIKPGLRRNRIPDRAINDWPLPKAIPQLYRSLTAKCGPVFQRLMADQDALEGAETASLDYLWAECTKLWADLEKQYADIEVLKRDLQYVTDENDDRRVTISRLKVEMDRIWQSTTDQVEALENYCRQKLAGVESLLRRHEHGFSDIDAENASLRALLSQSRETESRLQSIEKENLELKKRLAECRAYLSKRRRIQKLLGMPPDLGAESGSGPIDQ